MLVVSLTGCVSPVSDMLNNQFTTITPEASGIDGLWTGNNGPYLVTLKFNKDGTGIYCASMTGAEYLYKFKTNGSDLITQDGIKQTIKEKSSNSLILRVSYLGVSNEFKYIPDNDLKNASIYCQKELKEL